METTGPPTYAKAHRLAPECPKQAKAEIEPLIRLCIIRPSSETGRLHSTPFLRTTARTDNAVTTVHATHELWWVSALSPTFRDSHHNLQVLKYTPESTIPRPSTTSQSTHRTFRRQLSSHFLLSLNTLVPFGLKKSAQTFQRFMHKVLHGLPFYFTYIDDIPILSPDEATHLDHLKQVFTRLQAYGIHVDKSEFGVTSIDFL
ncbi:uncharacterized protein LOC143035887 [Oratosquilla oratoria]|uniref:uncharacterized protein LOC143035887 n=1 Tax=Oratosquilla oratoria TaxID=337810 RepID=UPI003F76398A